MFAGAIASGGVVKALNAADSPATQGQIETMTEYAKGFGAKDSPTSRVENGEWKSPIVRILQRGREAALTSSCPSGGRPDPVCRRPVAQRLRNPQQIRLYCAEVLRSQGKLTIPAGPVHFLWVVEFRCSDSTVR